jgi:hypothetical protein
MGHWDAGISQSYSGSGNTWFDLSGNGYHGTGYGGTPAYTSGSNGYFQFSGSNYWEVADTNDLKPPSSAITVIAVFSPPSGGSVADGIVYNKENSYEMAAHGGQIMHAFVPDWRWDGYFPHTAGAWYFTAVTFDTACVQKLYVNSNVPFYTRTIGCSMPTNSEVLRFGARSGPGSYFLGKIGMIQIYNRKLSDNEIATSLAWVGSRYSLAASYTISGLIGMWDAGNSQSYPGSGNTWYDLSGFAQHATGYNSPSFSSSVGNGYFQFNGGNFWEVADTARLRPDTSCISVIAIFSPPSGGNANDGIVYNKENSWEMAAHGGQITHAFQPDWRWDGYFSHTAGAWYFTAVTYSNTECVQRLYVSSGSPHYTQSIGCGMAQYGDVLRFGARSGPSSFFHGKIAVIQVYNRKLSDQEVLNNYNAFRYRYNY